MASQFHYQIKSYDFHTYFKLGDGNDTEQAKQFKESIEKEFSKEFEEGSARLFKTWNQQLGPHPDGYGMFESDTRSPEVFLKLLNFYQLNHGSLSVLIHPRSGRGALSDHTKHALWLGEKLQLKEDTLNDQQQ